MRKRFTPLFNGLFRVSLLSVASIGTAVAAASNCAALGPLPATLEVGEGLQQALQLAQGNKTKAARLLQLSYKAFLYRLEKYQLAD